MHFEEITEALRKKKKKKEGRMEVTEERRKWGGRGQL